MDIECKASALALCLGLVFVAVGCGDDKVGIEESAMIQRNPTNYEFSATISDVKNALVEARGAKWKASQGPFQGGHLAWKGDGNPFTSGGLSESGIDEVVSLYGMGNAAGKSKVYLKDRQELTYYADFNIRLTPKGTSNTLVNVSARNSKVMAGTEFRHFARAGVFVEVEPTSIEEYQILLDIGKQLGIQDMPQMVLPDTNAPTLKRKKSRSR